MSRIKFVDIFIVLFYILLTLALGLVAVGLALEVIPVATLVTVLETIPAVESIQLYVLGVGGSLVLLSFLLLIMLFQRGRQSRHLIFKNQGGQIQVSISALEQVVRDTVQGFLDIKGIHPRIQIRHNDVSVRTFLTLYSGVSINTLAERVQQEIRDRLESLLGEKIKISVIVTVKHISKRHLERKKQEVPDRSMQFN
jgi:uncharacterized alkaline shock family protein YloU